MPSRITLARLRGFWLWFFLALVAIGAQPARAEDVGALYSAYWAGLPAGDIRLVLRDDAGVYRNEIEIRTTGLPRLVTRFQGSASAAGRQPDTGLPAPQQYDALYELHKRRDRRLSMRFEARGGSVVVERGPGDTSKKPPLAERFRTDVLDPLSALSAIRQELRHGARGSFAVPVYDGARRFDVRVRVLPKSGGEPVLRLDLTLAPIAGFKGETSEEGDPDDSPRPATLAMSDDARLMPLSMKVSLYYLPLVVELRRWCGAAAPCQW